ncbi:hypothetical protein GQ457_12G010680 [Hibiscus cannabinus]
MNNRVLNGMKSCGSTTLLERNIFQLRFTNQYKYLQVWLKWCVDFKETHKFAEKLSIKKMAESKRGLMMFRPFFEKLRKRFSSSAHSLSPTLSQSTFDEDMSVGKAVPGDVKEGFFAVSAGEGKETQRFVIELDHLTNPEFLCLLDQARDEYGSHQKGVLSLPCQPHELEEILEHGKENNVCNES